MSYCQSCADYERDLTRLRRAHEALAQENKALRTTLDTSNRIAADIRSVAWEAISGDRGEDRSLVGMVRLIALKLASAAKERDQLLNERAPAVVLGEDYAVHAGREGYRVNSDEWFRAEDRLNWYLTCCDCGLTHKAQSRVINGEAEFRHWRDDETTTLQRERTPQMFPVFAERDSIRAESAKLREENEALAQERDEWRQCALFSKGVIYLTPSADLT